MQTPELTMMHGTDYAGQDPTNWIVTEKFDGFFARWTGSALLTREGVNYNAPEWFTAGLPYFACDCELFAGYGKRTTLNGAHRWKDQSRWRDAELIVFDVPKARGGYEDRHNAIVKYIQERPGLRITRYGTCSGRAGLIEVLAAVKDRGGEGLVIREPKSLYTIGRVQTMLKVKPEFIQAVRQIVLQI